MRQNQTTIEQLFRSHYVRMFRLARVLLHDDEDSKDAVSDVFSRLMESDILPDSDNMEGYLTVAVRHRCIDIINRRQLRERVERLLPVNMEVAPLDVDHEIRLSEMHHYVDEMLTEQTQQIFHKRFDELKSFRDIARELNISERTVYKHLKQAITKLHKHFNYLDNGQS